MEFPALVPAPGDRAVMIGQTGCGKTTLARVMLETRAHVVVLDTKRQIRWPDYRIYQSLDRLAGARERRLIYKPSWEAMQDDDEMEAFFSWVYQRQYCTCYVDELAQITRGDEYPRHLGACLQQGRELHIELWTATQRPKRVPQIAFSEAEHTYCFYLKMPQDRARVEDMTGVTSEHIAGLPKRAFYYDRQDGEVVGPLTLNLTPHVEVTGAS